MKRIAAVVLLSALLSAAGNLFGSDEKPRISFSGVLWTSYWASLGSEPSPSTERGQNAFEIKRAYLIASAPLNEQWSWKITYEFSGAPTLYPFAKVALVKWAPRTIWAESLTFGLQPTLIWGLSEEYWGYRPVMVVAREGISKTIVGINNELITGASSDFGFTWSIRPIPQTSISLQVANGAGHKGVEANRQKKVSGAVTVKWMPEGVVQLYIEDEPGYNDGVKKVSRTGLGLLTGFRSEQFAAGVDYFVKNFDDKSATDEVIAYAVSFFGDYALTNKLKLLGRVDRYDLQNKAWFRNNFNGKPGETLIIAGADCSYGPPNTHFTLTCQSRIFEAKIQDGDSYVDRNPSLVIALDVAMSF